jgi:hypothetical protein
MSSSDFREKVKQLESELAKAQTSCAASSSISGTIILAVAAPIVAFLALYIIKPSFVEEEDNGKTERSLKKVLMWATAITLVVWGCIYGYSMYTGGNQDVVV